MVAFNLDFMVALNLDSVTMYLLEDMENSTLNFLTSTSTINFGRHMRVVSTADMNGRKMENFITEKHKKTLLLLLKLYLEKVNLQEIYQFSKN